MMKYEAEVDGVSFTILSGSDIDGVAETVADKWGDKFEKFKINGVTYESKEMRSLP